MKKINFKYKEQPIEISITKNNTSITNSYKIRKSIDMLNILEEEEVHVVNTMLYIIEVYLVWLMNGEYIIYYIH